MTSIPNPWLTESSTATEDIKACPAVGEPLTAGATDPFSDEPLPLFLTEPHEEIDRGIEAILRVIFGIYDARGLA